MKNAQNDPVMLRHELFECACAAKYSNGVQNFNFAG